MNHFIFIHNEMHLHSHLRVSQHLNSATQVSFFCKLDLEPEAFRFPLFCFSPWWPQQDNCGSVASFLRSAAGGGLPRDLDDVTIPDFPDVSRSALAGGQGCDVAPLLLRLPVVLLLFLPFCALQSCFYSSCRRLICAWTVIMPRFCI